MDENVRFCSKCGSSNQKESIFCQKCGANMNAIQTNEQSNSSENVKKKWIITFYLTLFLGILGIHRFYNGKIVTGLIMLFTLGGGFIWWFIDFILVATWAFTDKKGSRLEKTKNCIPIAWGSFGIIAIIIILLIFNFSGFNISSLTNSFSTPKKLTMSKEEYIALAQSYTYEEISRNPDNYKGKPSVFTGKVVQVLENGNNITIRVNVTQGGYYWSDTIWVDYIRKDQTESRILDDDIIKIYGDMNGLKSYTSTLRATITIPWIIAHFIER